MAVASEEESPLVLLVADVSDRNGVCNVQFLILRLHFDDVFVSMAAMISACLTLGGYLKSHL